MESPEDKLTTLGSLLDFFACEISSPGAGVNSTGVNSLYGKAVRSLCSFVGNDRSVSLDHLGEVLPSWLVSLRMRDVSLVTALDYLKSISGLYGRTVRRGLVPSVEVFSSLRGALLQRGDALWRSGIARSDYSRFQNFLTSSLVGDNDVSVYLILLSFFCGGCPVHEVSKWRKRCLPPLDSVSASVVERQLSRSSREYLFSLSQSKRTPRQLERYVNGIAMETFVRQGINVFGSADETVRSYWSYSALSCGHRAVDVLSCLQGVPVGVPFLGLCPPSSGSPVTFESLRKSVSSQYISAPLRWYAMRLRPRVSYEDLTDRLSALGASITIPELFYPCREIAKRIGRKIVFSSEPFISQVVFFRMRYADISGLFGSIGDLAWCYRSGSGSDSVYSAISESSFSAFQQAIGRFTSGMLQSPAPEERLSLGDDVVIVGGNCQDQSGEIIKLEESGVDGMVTYLVRIFNRLTSNFTVRVSPRQLRKVTVAHPTVHS